MSQINIVGRIAGDFELQKSANHVPYARFGLIENIGYGERARSQYYEVWAYAEAANRLIKGKARKGSLLWVSGQLELVEFQRRDQTKDKGLKVTLDSWRFIPTGKPQGSPRDNSFLPSENRTPPNSEVAQAMEVLDGDRETLPD